MKKQDKIKQLQEEIFHIENEIKNCRHEFKDPIYDPEEISVQDDRAGYEERGVDRWPIYSSHKETKSRWSRECEHCGHKEYTYKKSPVIKEYKPDFS